MQDIVTGEQRIVMQEPCNVYHTGCRPLEPLFPLVQEFETQSRYAMYQTQEDFLDPIRSSARLGSSLLNSWRQYGVDDVLLRYTSGWLELIGNLRLTHTRPSFDISSVVSEERTVAVHEETISATPFATLLHFRKVGLQVPQPRVLVVAPMSGHFATLLRGTIRTLLQDHDVYVADWHSARDVELSAGPFTMDSYARHLIDFLGDIGPGAHIVAVCQPCVAALTAVARMSEDRDLNTPISMTLMAGPIDTRVNPTDVNRLAVSKPLSWFKRKLITTVPSRYKGANRRVYPGFIQLAAFIAMNQARHVGTFGKLVTSRTKSDAAGAEAIRSFYNEYLACADLPEEFYIETVDQIFQRHALPRGELMFEGRVVKPSEVVRTFLLTVEGERDDICAVGQTLAAQDLCTDLKPFLRRHHVQTGVGHYGVFSGSRWEEETYPIVRECIFNAENQIGRRIPASTLV